MLRLLLSGTAGLANAWTRLQKADFPAGKTTVMHEFVAPRTARPPTAPHRFIAIEPELANFAVPGFNPQQHGLPITGRSPDTHKAEV